MLLERLDVCTTSHDAACMIVATGDLVFRRAHSQQLRHVVDKLPAAKCDQCVIEQDIATSWGATDGGPRDDVLLPTICDATPPLTGLGLAEPSKQCRLLALASIQIFDTAVGLAPPAVAIVAIIATKALALFRRPPWYWRDATAEMHARLAHPRRLGQAHAALRGKASGHPFVDRCAASLPCAATDPTAKCLEHWQAISLCRLAKHCHPQQLTCTIHVPSRSALAQTPC